MQSSKKHLSFTNLEWLAWAGPLPPKLSGQLRLSGNFPRQEHRWVQIGAGCSSPDSLTPSSIDKIRTPLSSSQLPTNADALVTGGDAHSKR
jgi:hypothetical protein